MKGANSPKLLAAVTICGKAGTQNPKYLLFGAVAGKMT
jgi:hypothetical protein